MLTIVEKHRKALRTVDRMKSWHPPRGYGMSKDLGVPTLVRRFNRAGIKFVLMGAHAVNTYRPQSRSTDDIDLLVSEEDLEKATSIVRRAYPDLRVEDYPPVVRFIETEEDLPVVDLMKPTTELLKATFKESVSVGSYLIPRIEIALAHKYSAFISPNRKQPKKFQDAADFIVMAQRTKGKVNKKKLIKFGDMVYPGGGEELLRYFEDAVAERKLEI